MKNIRIAKLTSCSFLLAVMPMAAEEAPAAAPSAPSEQAAPAKLDFGDFSSATLTGKAWAASGAGQHDQVDGYTGKCIEMFEGEAVKMQKGLTEPAPADKANSYWALNDVGTCYFIRAQSREARGDAKGAIADYKAIVEKLPFAQCWDVQGWFWKPADAAKGKLKELEFDAEG